MGILDGIVEWIAEQVMHGLDLVSTSVLGALGCDMSVFLRYFPAAGTLYEVFVALSIGIILLNWVWQLFKNYGLGAGIEAEDPVKLSPEERYSLSHGAGLDSTDIPVYSRSRSRFPSQMP